MSRGQMRRGRSSADKHYADDLHDVHGPLMVSAGSFVSLTGGHGDNDPPSSDQALPRRANMADNGTMLDEEGAALMVPTLNAFLRVT